MSVLQSTPDQFVWQLTVWREAMNQGLDGMEAVAWVMINRLKSGKHGGSLMEVCTERLQFSSMTALGDPMTVKWPTHMNVAEANAWRLAEIACSGVEDGSVPDPTHGATYYANLATAKSGWFFENIVRDTVNHPQTAQINNHTFYR